ncbi:MAG: hypothetical protein MJE77_39070 [Proteobacteria bacterium]|nr:hypothetical protein [Pseudomonadota bacterium]
MPLVVGCLAIVSPRFALFLVWLFGGDYLARAVDSGGWLLLGFLFMPLTTLAFVYSMNSLGAPGQVPPLGWVLVIVAILLDLGLVGSGHSSARRHLNRNSE